MKHSLSSRLLFLSIPLAMAPLLAPAQEVTPQQMVAKAVANELYANANDHTPLEYLDHDITPDHDTLYRIIQVPHGGQKRKLEDHGHPLTPAQNQAEDARIQSYVNDIALQQRQHRDSAHDDEQASEMVRLLPVAFIWTVHSSTPAETTLDFRPDPNFNPRSMEAKVLSAMSGQVVVAHPDERIKSIRGKLLHEVKFAYGLLGYLSAGGNFNVERREVIPGHWQITDSHVHFDGKALFFKTIGEQEDETMTGYKLSPATSLQQAADILTKHP
jgi:hypothetical protein